MKFCPNCGDAVEPGDEVCETCGAELAGVDASPSAQPGPPIVRAEAAVTVADLSLQQLRREIRRGVFQGILLAAVVVFLVLMAVWLLVAVVIGAIANG